MPEDLGVAPLQHFKSLACFEGDDRNDPASSEPSPMASATSSSKKRKGQLKKTPSSLQVHTMSTIPEVAQEVATTDEVADVPPLQTCYSSFSELGDQSAHLPITSSISVQPNALAPAHTVSFRPSAGPSTMSEPITMAMIEECIAKAQN